MSFLFILIIFIFKQKTAYEMRISDWSSDVCSSDLAPRTRDRLQPFAEFAVQAVEQGLAPPGVDRPHVAHVPCEMAVADEGGERGLGDGVAVGVGAEIGRASGRARVCQ